MDVDQRPVGLERVTLSELLPESTNSLVVGIIIAKQDVRRFSKTAQNGVVEAAVWNFTFRDTASDYINVTCWGESHILVDISEKYLVGDVIEIHRPKIDIRQVNDYGEQFRPMVTSPYSFTLNAAEVQLVKNTMAASDMYLPLLNMTTKPIVGAVTLADVHNNGPNTENVVDLLGVVRHVGKMRQIKTRHGKELSLRDLIILDRTHPELKISIWDTDTNLRAEQWKPRTTILFMTDVRIKWSNFDNCMTASLSSRTVVTENPSSREAENLRQYAETAPLKPLQILDHMTFNVPDVNSIQNVMNVKQVYERIDSIIASPSIAHPEDQMFTCVLYALITQLDLDGLSRIITTKCNSCNTLLDAQIGKCTNTECTIGNGIEEGEPEVSFDIRVMLTDQTGTLVGCHLKGHIAEAILGCTVEQFVTMSDDEKSGLKWKFLMERCEVRIMVLCIKNRNALISILNCGLANPYDVSTKLPHY